MKLPKFIDKRFYSSWKFGVIEGFIIGLLLFGLVILPTIQFFQLIVLAFVAATSFFTYQKVNEIAGSRAKLFKPITVNSPIQKQQEPDGMAKARESRKPCPECGSKTIHKTNCSLNPRNQRKEEIKAT